MNEQQVNDLKKASADSATALSKIAAVETSLAELKTGLEKQFSDIGDALGKLTKAIVKMSGVDASAPTVARTAVPTVTVTKTDDTTGQPPKKDMHKVAGSDRAVSAGEESVDGFKAALGQSYADPKDPQQYLRTTR